MSAYYVTGKTLDVCRKMPDDSVDLILTSPPFLALRSYLPADDPNKPYEIGQESTPGEFLDVLLDLTEEWARVLAPHGSLCVELGDTFSGSGGAGGDYSEGGMREGQPRFRSMGTREHRPPGARADGGGGTGGLRERSMVNVVPMNGGPGWPDAKSLCLIPELYRFALSYGFNPLTGRTTPRWRVRNVIRWVRPNPPVGALGDKFRPATSEMVVACKARDRYFDLDAVREHTGKTPNPRDVRHSGNKGDPNGGRDTLGPYAGNENPAGAPPLDWWEIPTHAYPGSHYATYPPELCVRPVKSMCPEKVCRTCGEPSRRIVETSVEDRLANRERSGFAARDGREDGGYVGGYSTPATSTLGWTDCGHNDWRPGRVLDPFAGSGTTLAVATGHGRDAVGIDLDKRNVDLARDRVGPMFFQDVSVEQLVDWLEKP